MATIQSRRIGAHRSPLAPLWRAWWRARFLLTQRHRHNRLVLEQLGDLTLLVLPEVFNPTLFHSSHALVAALRREPSLRGKRVLDMGTGSGVIGLAAACRSAHVVAVDLLPAAVRCARTNAMLNGFKDRIEVREGDLFGPVAGERFDLVLFNPPFYRGVPRQPWQLAWRSPDVIERFAAGLRTVLAPGGKALLVVSSDVTGLDEAAAANHLATCTVWERNYIAERMMVLEWTPVGGAA